MHGVLGYWVASNHVLPKKHLSGKVYSFLFWFRECPHLTPCTHRLLVWTIICKVYMYMHLAYTSDLSLVTLCRTSTTWPTSRISRTQCTSELRGVSIRDSGGHGCDYSIKFHRKCSRPWWANIAVLTDELTDVSSSYNTIGVVVLLHLVIMSILFT